MTVVKYWVQYPFHVIAILLPKDPNRLVGTILTSVHTTQRTHMQPQQDGILLLNNNRPKSHLLGGQSEKLLTI